MAFLGADTTALRAQSEHFTTGGARIAECSSTLTAVVMTVDWHGPDAEDLRERWVATAETLRVLGELVRDRGTDLALQADAQDSTSAGDHGGTLNWSDLLAGVGLDPSSVRRWIGEAAHRASNVIGFLDKLGSSERRPEDGLPWAAGGDSPFLAALTPGDGAPRWGHEPTMHKYKGDYDNPEDEFSIKAGEGGPSSTSTLGSGMGDELSVTKNADGSYSSKVSISDQLAEQKLGGKNASLSYEVDVTTSGEVKKNSDGTVTYTMTSELSREARAEIKAKYGPAALEAYGTAGNGSETKYSVTVPEGTSRADAMAINPYDPSSIPKGATVSFSSSESTSRGGGASIGIPGADLMTVSGEHTSSEGDSTSVSRNDDGTLSVTTGPTREMTDSGTFALGPDQLNVHLGKSTTDTESVYEKATFADNSAGRSAYQDAVTAGRFPDNASDGVLETFTETHRTEVVDTKSGFTAGDIASRENSSNLTSYEEIRREYPDGHWESAEQWLPKGDAETTQVIRSDSSERDATYSLIVDNSAYSHPRSPTSEFEKEFGVRPTGDKAGILLSEKEAQTIATNNDGLGAIPEGLTPGESVSLILNDNKSSEADIEDLKSGHNRNPDGGVDGTKPAPGIGYDPATHTVKDGKIVPKSG